MYKQQKNNQTSFLLDKSKIEAKIFLQKKCFHISSGFVLQNKHFYNKKCPLHSVKISTSTSLDKKQLLTARSKCFGGQLNRSWVNKDLYRYELNFTQLHKLGVAEKTNLNRSATTEPKPFLLPLAFPKLFLKEKQEGKVKERLASYLLTAADIASAKTVTQPLKNKLLPFGCLYLDKIILHSNSGKLLQVPSSSAIMDLAFSTISCQTPMQIYSRKSIAGFKLTKSALLGVKTTLRGLAKLEFYYKWYFLGASVPKIAPMHFATTLALPKGKVGVTSLQQRQQPSTFLRRNKQKKTMPAKSSARSSSLAIQNVFVFTELDRLDYDYFSTLSGFEIFFVENI